jgi:hypothetical protein
MQRELEAEAHALDVAILGVNHAGMESGNAAFCSGRDLAWLQDMSTVDAWTAWGVVLRDVVILGPQNEVVGVFNLTTNSLLEQANYDALKSMLVGAANPTP